MGVGVHAFYFLYLSTSCIYAINVFNLAICMHLVWLVVNIAQERTSKCSIKIASEKMDTHFGGKLNTI